MALRKYGLKSNRILNPYLILKPYLTLGHIFAKPKDPVKTNQKTHAVYSISCGGCEKEYLGQSKRQFGTRLKEHQKTVSTLDKGKSALAEHVCYTKHEIGWENSNKSNYHKQSL